MGLLNLILSNFLSACIFMKISLKLFESKISKLSIFLLNFFIISSVMIPVNYYNESNYNANLLLIANILILFLGFKGRFYTKIFVVAIFVCFGSLIEIFVFVIFIYLFNIEYASMSINSYYYTLGTILTNILLFFTLGLYSKKFIPLSKNNYPNRIILLLCLPITSFLFISNFEGFKAMQNNGDILIPLTFLGLFFSNLIVFYVFFDTLQVLEENNEIKLEKSYREIEKLNYQLLETKYNNTQSILHDLNRHIKIIQQLIKNQSYSEINDYLNEIKGELDENHMLIKTKQKVLNLVVQQYINTIIENNILLKVDVDESDLSILSMYEQNIIFSNIIENAIESCLKTNLERIIIIKIKSNESRKIIKITNTCDNVVIEEGKFISIKKDVENHGYGLKNIEKIIHKKNGYIYFDYNEIEHTFQTMIVL